MCFRRHNHLSPRSITMVQRRRKCPEDNKVAIPSFSFSPFSSPFWTFAENHPPLVCASSFPPALILCPIALPLLHQSLPCSSSLSSPSSIFCPSYPSYPCSSIC